MALVSVIGQMHVLVGVAAALLFVDLCGYPAIRECGFKGVFRNVPGARTRLRLVRRTGVGYSHSGCATPRENKSARGVTVVILRQVRSQVLAMVR